MTTVPNEPINHIVVITNLSTGNVGNQGLSTELIKLIEQLPQEYEVSVLGRPIGYWHYTIEKLRLQGASQGLDMLNRWIDELVKEVEHTSCPKNYRNIQRSKPVKLKRPGHLYTLLKPLAKLIRYRHTVSALKSLIWGKQERVKRLCLLKNSDLVIYNPAGEINPYPGSFDVPFRQLLEILVAKRLGCRVIVANHSVELVDEFTKHVLTQAYSAFDKIIVRDGMSREFLKQIKVPSSRIVVVPDIALLSKPDIDKSRVCQIVKDEQISANTIGIAINYYNVQKNLEQWGKLIERLQEWDKKIIFVSNAFAQDKKIGYQLRQRYGIQVVSRQYDYDDYINLLSALEVVISNRLHTLVYAILADVPVIPIEPNMFKIDGLCQAINYPLSTIYTNQPDWHKVALNQFNTICTDYAPFQDKLRTRVDKARTLIRQSYADIITNTY